MYRSYYRCTRQKSTPAFLGFGAYVVSSPRCSVLPEGILLGRLPNQSQNPTRQKHNSRYMQLRKRHYRFANLCKNSEADAK